jgi:hypothetical protein
VEYADIRAGVVAPGFSGGPTLDAQISSITVGQNWLASNLTAGIAAVASDNFALKSRIGPITVGGVVIGEATAANFEFKSEEIVSFKVGGTALPLQKGPRNDLAGFTVGALGDVKVVEVL